FGSSIFVFFFFQEEDGIRYWSVTGVQTCALPISDLADLPAETKRELEFVLVDSIDEVFAAAFNGKEAGPSKPIPVQQPAAAAQRSEERRVGKECRARWWRDHAEKKRRKRRSRGEQ